MQISRIERSELWTAPEELRVEALCSFDVSGDEMVFWGFQVDTRALGSVCLAEDTLLVYYDGELWGRDFSGGYSRHFIPTTEVISAVNGFLGGDQDGWTLRNAPDDYVDDEPAPTAQYGSSVAHEAYTGPTVY